jgi:hypothetical protein
VFSSVLGGNVGISPIDLISSSAGVDEMSHMSWKWILSSVINLLQKLVHQKWIPKKLGIGAFWGVTAQLVPRVKIIDKKRQVRT